MNRSKLLLIHIVAVNRCIQNKYEQQCFLDYCRSKNKLRLSADHCRAMGHILTDSCPVVDYVNMYRYLEDAVLHTLLNWS